jgi:GH25 family lysozyme M1 (1,4-beta-N-acetylmuramidase)
VIKTFKHGDETQISPHFKASEFQCKCGAGHDFQLDTDLVDNLEKLFTALDCSKIVISSGFRCKDHDISVGGDGTGQHTLGKAADFCCFDADKNPIVTYKVCCAAQDIGFRGIARINDAWTHCDVRSSGKWYGDETKGNNSVTDDFYKYFNMPKEAESMKSGIDISYCQTQVTWSEVTAEFVIVKAGQRDFTDPMFESHYKGAKSRGIPVGAYWYLDALTVEDAQKEADAFIQRLSGKQFEYPVFLDLENESQFQLGKKKVSDLIRAFLERVEKAGYWVGLYMSKSQLENYVDDDIKSRYCIWLAQWDVSKPTYGGAYGIWQYNVGKAAGIKGDCDLDYSYVDYPAQIKAKGLNGYGKQPDKPTENPDTDAGIEVEMTVNGKKYGGTLKPI